MPLVPERQTSSPGETTAEIQLLRSADDAGRIPFPEGSHREITTFLEALARLDAKGHVEHRLQNGLFGCFLTDSGKRLRSQLIAPQNEGGPELSDVSVLPPPTRQALLATIFGSLLWFPMPTQARLGETAERIEARYGVPVKVENGVSARDFQCTYKHGGLTIVVHYLDEKSQDECFANENGEAIATDDLQHLMEVNRRGGKWSLKEDNGSFKRWNLNSGEAIAVDDYKTGHWLEIKTIWWQHFVDQHSEEAQKGVSDRMKDF
ncbi:MAG TPA: hypothetical protein VGM54_06965 [Chthoniobacter sp.]|jgi:hypothetical protein